MMLKLASAATVVGSLVWPVSLLQEATGATAQSVCGEVFVSGFPADAFVRDFLRTEPGIKLIAWAMQVDVDAKQREVRARAFGGFQSRSVLRSGRGCTLVYPGGAEPKDLPPAAVVAAKLDIAMPKGEIVAGSPAVKAAVDKAFEEPAAGPPRKTLAVVALHRGQLVGERYAPDIGPDTPLLSHSIAKSVVNALVGILVRDGKLRAEDPAPIAAWKGDARNAITIDNLLRMRPGFGFDEGGGPSISTHIWFTQADMATAAQAATLTGKPGQTWGYCSRCYMILSRILGDQVGGGAQGLRDFAQRELFGPLGMQSAVLEFDPHDTMMGGNALYATPRDYARFGLLYLRDGIIGGHRILPEGWASASARGTSDVGYGSGFWLNTTSAQMPEWKMAWGIPGAPHDAFAARGFKGQYIVVVPSADLVVVRMGHSFGPGMEVASVGALVKDLVAALR